jgi:hypothetical protein
VRACTSIELVPTDALLLACVPQTFELVKEFTAHSRKVNGIMAVGDSHVWTASDDYSIIIWDAQVRSSYAIAAMTAPSIECDGLSHSLLFPFRCLPQPQTLEEVYRIQNAHSGYCYGLADFGSVVWTFGWDKRICLWDTKVPRTTVSRSSAPRSLTVCTLAPRWIRYLTSSLRRHSKTWVSCHRITETPSSRWSRCGITRRPVGKPGT